MSCGSPSGGVDPTSTGLLSARFHRSKGPRFRFFCEEHLKLPKKKQDEVLAKWAEKNA